MKCSVTMATSVLTYTSQRLKIVPGWILEKKRLCLVLFCKWVYNGFKMVYNTLSDKLSPWYALGIPCPFLCQEANLLSFQWKLTRPKLAKSYHKCLFRTNIYLKKVPENWIWMTKSGNPSMLSNILVIPLMANPILS